MRVQLQERQTTRAETASGVRTVRRDSIVGKGLASPGTDRYLRVGWVANVKVTHTFLIGRDSTDPGHAAYFAPPFFRPKEEQFVFLDGPAESVSKVVGPQFGPGLAGGIQEKVVGIQLVIAEELVDRAMKFVGSGLGNQVDLRAARRRAVRAVGVARHLEFFDRVH